MLVISSLLQSILNLLSNTASCNVVLLFQKTMAYVAYDLDETRGTVVEFEYNYGKTDYSKGTGYAQVRFEIVSICEVGLTY